MTLFQKIVKHDQMVYLLYRLAVEEIAVVEGAVADTDKPAEAKQ